MVSNGQKVDSEVFDAETFILLLNWPCFVMLSFTYLNSEIVCVLYFFTRYFTAYPSACIPEKLYA